MHLYIHYLTECWIIRLKVTVVARSGGRNIATAQNLTVRIHNIDTVVLDPIYRTGIRGLQAKKHTIMELITK